MRAQFTLTLTREQASYLSSLLYRDLMPAQGCGGIAYSPGWVKEIPKPIAIQLQDQLPTRQNSQIVEQLEKVK